MRLVRRYHENFLENQAKIAEIARGGNSAILAAKLESMSLARWQMDNNPIMKLLNAQRRSFTDAPTATSRAMLASKLDPWSKSALGHSDWSRIAAMS